jgi:ketosteroid isomerase-like protein
MSQENVEKIRAAYEQFNRTHEPDRNLLHPAIEWHTAPDLPDSGTHRGHDGVARLFSEWAGSFEDFRADLEEVIEAGSYVVAAVRLRGRLRGGGDEVVLPETHVWKMVNGKAVEVREYRTKTEALEAAGLPG